MQKRTYALLVITLITSTTSYSYEVILSEIVNNTPSAITFVGKEVAFPMPVPTVPSQPMPTITARSKHLSFPIIIPARSRKVMRKQIVNNEESRSPAEIFFNFKDKNNNLVSIIARSGQIFKFAPLLGWERETLDFTDPNGRYHVSFVFEGKDGISDAKIKRTHDQNALREKQDVQDRRRY